MKTHISPFLCLILLVFLPSITGCRTKSNIPAGKSYQDAELEEVVLTFDGETCQYAGPQSAAAGDIIITLINQSDYETSVWIVRMYEGRTWQDMLDHIGTPGSNVHPPSWSSSGFMIATIPDKPDSRIYSLKQGLYAVCCCTCNETTGPQGVWPGAPLEITDKTD